MKSVLQIQSQNVLPPDQGVEPLRTDIYNSQELHVQFLGQEHTVSCLDIWSELEHKYHHNRLTSSSSWVRNWLRIYGNSVNYEFAVADIAGQYLGIALIVHSRHLKNGYYRIRTIHLGTAGEPMGHSAVVEYNSIIIDEAYQTEFLKIILHNLMDRNTWDELHLDGFAEDDLHLATYTRILPASLHHETHARESRYTNLKLIREKQTDVLSVFGKSTKSNLKRKIKAYDDLQLEWAENLEQGLNIFEELVSLHQARWQQQGMPGAFFSDKFLQFQQGLIKDLLGQQKVVLFRARGNHQTIGCLMLLVDQNRLLDYLSGFAPFVTGTSPGLVTHYLCMEQALIRGFDAYDFLVGDKRHKENLGKDVVSINWYKLQRKTWKFLLQEKLRQCKRFLQKSTKNNAVSSNQNTDE